MTDMDRSEIERRRDEYRATHEAQRRAAADPVVMAALREKLAAVDERVQRERDGSG